jgi:hypothetical protein
VSLCGTVMCYHVMCDCVEPTRESNVVAGNLECIDVYAAGNLELV